MSSNNFSDTKSTTQQFIVTDNNGASGALRNLLSHELPISFVIKEKIKSEGFDDFHNRIAEELKSELDITKRPLYSCVWYKNQKENGNQDYLIVILDPDKKLNSEEQEKLICYFTGNRGVGLTLLGVILELLVKIDVMQKAEYKKNNINNDLYIGCILKSWKSKDSKEKHKDSVQVDTFKVNIGTYEFKGGENSRISISLEARSFRANNLDEISAKEAKDGDFWSIEKPNKWKEVNATKYNESKFLAYGNEYAKCAVFHYQFIYKVLFNIINKYSLDITPVSFEPNDSLNQLITLETPKMRKLNLLNNFTFFSNEIINAIKNSWLNSYFDDLNIISTYDELIKLPRNELIMSLNIKSGAKGNPIISDIIDDNKDNNDLKKNSSIILRDNDNKIYIEHQFHNARLIADKLNQNGGLKSIDNYTKFKIHQYEKNIRQASQGINLGGISNPTITPDPKKISAEKYNLGKLKSDIIRRVESNEIGSIIIVMRSHDNDAFNEIESYLNKKTKKWNGGLNITKRTEGKLGSYEITDKTFVIYVLDYHQSDENLKYSEKINKNNYHILRLHNNRNSVLIGGKENGLGEEKMENLLLSLYIKDLIFNKKEVPLNVYSMSVKKNKNFDDMSSHNFDLDLVYIRSTKNGRKKDKEITLINVIVSNGKLLIKDHRSIKYDTNLELDRLLGNHIVRNVPLFDKLNNDLFYVCDNEKGVVLTQYTSRNSPFVIGKYGVDLNQLYHDDNIKGVVRNVSTFGIYQKGMKVWLEWKDDSCYLFNAWVKTPKPVGLHKQKRIQVIKTFNDIGDEVPPKEQKITDFFLKTLTYDTLRLNDFSSSSLLRRIAMEYAMV